MVTLIILDGFGESIETYGNAIKQQGTPNIDKLKLKYPNTLIKASGEAVGLSDGQMGNSEVGHLNLGAGRIVLQDLSRINEDIKSGKFQNNEEFKRAFKHSKVLHLMGLVSDGGVHSHISHLKTLIDMAYNSGVEKIYVHVFTDGRDTLKDSALNYVSQLEDFMKNKNAEIATIMGRFYAMDREKRYDRVMKAYDAICLGQAERFYQSATEAIKESYDDGIYDEFIEPTIIGKPKTINSGDSVIFFNFRTDRPRELTEAITEDNFSKFPTKKLSNLYFVTMTNYSDELKNVHVAYPAEVVRNGLSEIISKAGLKQYHIAETTKYAHVTFFFNGGREESFENEDRKLIETKNVKDFSEFPEMRAFEIAEDAMSAISLNKYDFVLINFSNPDMIGHTANMEATKRAIQVVDKCAYAVCMATILAGGDCIITADHGNAECLLDKNDKPVTAHSSNPVPFILASEKFKKVKLIENGILANVAPTVLELLNIKKPDSMTCSMIKH